MRDSYVQFGAEDYIRAGNETTVDLNATFAFASGKYSLTGNVRNLTDNEYIVHGYGMTTMDSAGINAAGRNYVNTTAQVDDPRTWGVVLSGRF